LRINLPSSAPPTSTLTHLTLTLTLSLTHTHRYPKSQTHAHWTWQKNEDALPVAGDQTWLVRTQHAQHANSDSQVWLV
jgi:hypothetical protein